MKKLILTIIFVIFSLGLHSQQADIYRTMYICYQYKIPADSVVSDTNVVWSEWTKYKKNDQIIAIIPRESVMIFNEKYIVELFIK